MPSYCRGCRLSVHPGGASPAITWRVHNPGLQAFAFQAALHTYLRVADADQAHIKGLACAAYLDSWADRRPSVQREALLGLAGGLDRIYPAARSDDCGPGARGPPPDGVRIEAAEWYSPCRFHPADPGLAASA